MPLLQLELESAGKKSLKIGPSRPSLSDDLVERDDRYEGASLCSRRLISSVER